MRVRTGGEWKEVPGGRVRVGGAWKNLVGIRAYISGAWKDVASFVQPMTFSVAPDSIVRSQEIPGTATTQSAVGTPTGGRAPFTYAWTRLSGDASITITSPTSSSTTFRRFVDAEQTYVATFRCTCTDADGTALTDDVSVSITGFDLIVE